MTDSTRIPQIIRDVGFDFSWDERKVWALSVPIESVPTIDLAWHLEVPFLWWDGGVYNLTPRAVIADPDRYREEYERTLSADTSYPIDLMMNKGQWLILDGLHRLMKATIEGLDHVQVRKHSRDVIPQILSAPEQC